MANGIGQGILAGIEGYMQQKRYRDSYNLQKRAADQREEEFEYSQEQDRLNAAQRLREFKSADRARNAAIRINNVNAAREERVLARQEAIDPNNKFITDFNSLQQTVFPGNMYKDGDITRGLNLEMFTREVWENPDFQGLIIPELQSTLAKTLPDGFAINRIGLELSDNEETRLVLEGAYPDGSPGVITDPSSGPDAQTVVLSLEDANQHLAGIYRRKFAGSSHGSNLAAVLDASLTRSMLDTVYVQAGKENIPPEEVVTAEVDVLENRVLGEMPPEAYRGFLSALDRAPTEEARQQLLVDIAGDLGIPVSDYLKSRVSEPVEPVGPEGQDPNTGLSLAQPPQPPQVEQKPAPEKKVLLRSEEEEMLEKLSGAWNWAKSGIEEVVDAATKNVEKRKQYKTKLKEVFTTLKDLPGRREVSSPEQRALRDWRDSTNPNALVSRLMRSPDLQKEFETYGAEEFIERYAAKTLPSQTGVADSTGPTRDSDIPLSSSERRLYAQEQVQAEEQAKAQAGEGAGFTDLEAVVREKLAALTAANKPLSDISADEAERTPENQAAVVKYLTDSGVSSDNDIKNLPPKKQALLYASMAAFAQDQNVRTAAAGRIRNLVETGTFGFSAKELATERRQWATEERQWATLRESIRTGDRLAQTAVAARRKADEEEKTAAYNNETATIEMLAKFSEDLLNAVTDPKTGEMTKNSSQVQNAYVGINGVLSKLKNAMDVAIGDRDEAGNIRFSSLSARKRFNALADASEKHLSTYMQHLAISNEKWFHKSDTVKATDRLEELFELKRGKDGKVTVVTKMDIVEGLPAQDMSADKLKRAMGDSAFALLVGVLERKERAKKAKGA